MYYSWGNPEGLVLIATNHYNERTTETIMLTIGTIYMGWLGIKRIQKLADTEIEREVAKEVLK